MRSYSQVFIQDFLKRSRELVVSNSLPVKRLPRWIKAAGIKTAKLNNSRLFLLEDSVGDKDTFYDFGTVKSDLQFFLRLPARIPKTASLQVPEKASGLALIIGEYGAKERVILDIKASSTGAALFNAGYVDYHSPISLVNVCLRLNVEEDVLGVCFIPFALYVHDIDFVDDLASFWSKCESWIQDMLLGFSNSPAGDYYERTAEAKSAIWTTKENSAIVFGKYTGLEKNELLQVRDHLISKKYDAHLLEELPEHPSMSMEEKARFWSSATRFSVMIDREPSGALAEYQFFKDGRVVLALLRQKGKSSTSMIGDEPLVDINYIRIFEFEASPLEVVDDAIAWAEELVKKRIDAYGKLYPWRMG